MSRIIGPMTASDTAMWLRKELEFAREAVRRQRAVSKTQRQLLRRIADRHRRGDRGGVAWHIENWPELLEKWAGGAGDERITNDRD